MSNITNIHGGSPQSSVIPFDFNGSQVRVLTGDDDEPRWVASDVAKILGYREARDMTRNLDDDEKGPQIVRTPGGNQSMTVITESGLYAAVLKSRVPGAAEFRRWVTREVLPSIRKTGSYELETLTNEQLMAKALLAANDTINQMQVESAEKDRKIETQDAMILEMAAPAAAWSSIVNADGLIYVNDAAKMLGVGPNKFRAILRECYVLQSAKQYWNRPYQKYVDKGLFAEKISVWEDDYGDDKIKATTFITVKGMEWLIQKDKEGWFDDIKATVPA